MTDLSLDSHYVSGEEIHVGDRVKWGDSIAIVKFVLQTASFASEFDAKAWSYLGRGFMVESEKAGLVFFEQADEDLFLLQRQP